MKIKDVFKTFLLICTLQHSSTGSALSDAAAAMAPGTFRPLVTQNALNCFRMGPGLQPIFAFSNGGAWDPHTRQMLMVGAPHGVRMHFIRYQESDNAWYTDSSMPFGTDGWGGAHTYDQLTIDSSGIFYHIYWVDGITYRYDAPAGRWLDPLPATVPSYGCLDYFPDLNALVRFSRGNISVFRISQGRWDTVRAGLSIEGDYENLSQYCPAGKFMLFGGGSGNARDLYRMDTSLTVRALNPAPFDVRIGNNLAADPVTGTLIAVQHDSLYAYDPDQDRWTGLIKNPLPADAMIGVFPIGTYGVIALCSSSSWPVLLYKHAATVATEKAPKTAETDVLSASPNPFNGQTRISIGTDRPASVSIFDMNGKKIFQALIRGSVVWKAGNAPAGVYVVVVKKGMQRLAKQIIYSK